MAIQWPLINKAVPTHAITVLSFLGPFLYPITLDSLLLLLRFEQVWRLHTGEYGHILNQMVQTQEGTTWNGSKLPIFKEIGGSSFWELRVQELI